MAPEPVAASPERASSARLLLIAALIVASGALPLLAYWWLAGRAPAVSVAEARGMLAAPRTNAVLVDVREPAERADVPLPEAIAWPHSAIRLLDAAGGVPEALRGRALLLICSGGVRSAQAVEMLHRVGIGQAYSVAGGMQTWLASMGTEPPAFRATSRAEQMTLVTAIYPVKALYMLLSLVAVALLWNRGGRSLPALRWSMIFFFLGESACAVNIVGFDPESVELEYLHSWAMVVCLGFLAYAAIEALDGGLVHYGDPAARCAFAGVCRGCAKHQPGPCLMHRLFKWALPALMILSAMPLSAEPLPVSYNTSLFGVVRNLQHPMAIQLYELRFSPPAALALLAVAWLLLLWRERDPRALWLSKVALAAALGHLGFGIMRLAFLAFYRENLVWFVFWEELTEAILVAGVLVLLWLFKPEIKLAALALSRLQAARRDGPWASPLPASSHKVGESGSPRSEVPAADFGPRTSDLGLETRLA